MPSSGRTFWRQHCDGKLLLTTCPHHQILYVPHPNSNLFAFRYACRFTYHSSPVLYKTLFSFTGYLIEVPPVHGKSTLRTLIHRGLCPSFIRAGAYVEAPFNAQEFASAHVSHIIATYILSSTECTSTVLFQIFRSYCCSCILIRFGKRYIVAEMQNDVLYNQ